MEPDLAAVKVPALVQDGEDEEDQQDRQGEDLDRLVADDLFLQRHAGPTVADVGRQPVCGDLLNQGQRLARAEAGRRAAAQSDRRVEIVARAGRRPLQAPLLHADVLAGNQELLLERA